MPPPPLLLIGKSKYWEYFYSGEMQEYIKDTGVDKYLL